MVEKLDTAARTALAADLPDWTLDGEQLKRSLRFKDFSEAFAFMTRVAMLAEQHRHHPEWTNVYNTLEVRLCTHDAGNAITDKDHTLAAAIDRLLAQGDTPK